MVESNKCKKLIKVPVNCWKMLSVLSVLEHLSDIELFTVVVKKTKPAWCKSYWLKRYLHKILLDHSSYYKINTNLVQHLIVRISKKYFDNCLHSKFDFKYQYECL